MLEWPVFSTLDLGICGRSLALMHEVGDDSPGAADDEETSPGSPLDADHLPKELVRAASEYFLLNVHAKNPILDLENYEKAVTTCCTAGFTNTASSALVVSLFSRCSVCHISDPCTQSITCALGLVSQAYVTVGSRAYQPPKKDRGLRAHTEKFVKYGKSVLGAKRPSLLVTQCYFFCGVYEMFVLRPVTAWIHFSQASLHLKLHIQARPFSSSGGDAAERALVQRLYWSCMQSEWLVILAV